MKGKVVLSYVCGVLLATQLLGNEAVSKTNFKIDTFGGKADSETTKGLMGSLTMPILDSYGIQINSAYGEIDDLDSKGLGVHLFWRDKDIGLLGLTSSYSNVDKADMKRVGIEGEYYFEDVTIFANAGIRSGDVKISGYGELDISYYFINNLALTGGVIQNDDNTFKVTKLEFQPNIAGIDGLSTYIEYNNGENDYNSIMVGLRYYFGDKKPLKERHRYDDPSNDLFSNMIMDTYYVKKKQSTSTKIIHKSCEELFGYGYFGYGQDFEQVIDGFGNVLSERSILTSCGNGLRF